MAMCYSGDAFVHCREHNREGDIYLDKDLLQLVDDNNFQKTSDKIIAQVGEKDISAFVQVLKSNHGFVSEMTGDGNNWEDYYESDNINESVDIYFPALNKQLKESNDKIKTDQLFHV